LLFVLFGPLAIRGIFTNVFPFLQVRFVSIRLRFRWGSDHAICFTYAVLISLLMTLRCKRVLNSKNPSSLSQETPPSVSTHAALRLVHQIGKSIIQDHPALGFSAFSYYISRYLIKIICNNIEYIHCDDFVAKMKPSTSERGDASSGPLMENYRYDRDVSVNKYGYAAKLKRTELLHKFLCYVNYRWGITASASVTASRTCGQCQMG